jgi:hypothetical protein
MVALSHYYFEWVYSTQHSYLRLATIVPLIGDIKQTCPCAFSTIFTVYNQTACTSTLSAIQMYEDNTSCIVLAHSKGVQVFEMQVRAPH